MFATSETQQEPADKHTDVSGTAFYRGSLFMFYDTITFTRKLRKQILNTQTVKISCNGFFLHLHGKCGMVQLMSEESKLSTPKGCPFPPPTLSSQNSSPGNSTTGKDIRAVLNNPSKEIPTSPNHEKNITVTVPTWTLDTSLRPRTAALFQKPALAAIPPSAVPWSHKNLASLSSWAKSKDGSSLELADQRKRNR